MHAQPYLHPCGYLTHTQRTTCSRHGIPHTSTAFRYPDIPAAYFTTLTSQLKTNTRQQCCSPSDHTTQCAALYIAHCSYDTYNATILGDVTAELANATTYACVVRAVRNRSKIEIEIAILAISITNRGEHRSLRRRSRSRSPTLLLK